MNRADDAAWFSFLRPRRRPLLNYFHKQNGRQLTDNRFKISISARSMSDSDYAARRTAGSSRLCGAATLTGLDQKIQSAG